MGLVVDAEHVIMEANQRLQKLMEEALKNKNYEDLAQIAKIASGLTYALHDVNPVFHSTKPVVLPNHIENEDTTQSSKPRRLSVRLSEYPKFRVDGDKLVKIGWSKKDRKEYEHRAPKAVLLQLVQRILELSIKGGRFATDDLIPLKADGEAEVPSYQAYLALAWLRHLRFVEQKGRDGYEVAVGFDALSSERIEELWNNTGAANDGRSI